MCGIAGYYSLNQTLEPSLLKTMTNAIQHRGPDSDGFFNDRTAGLGHRRLSIIDLREVANQPMFSHNDRYVMVFNGEVYNFKELSSQVRVKNDSFYYKTNSDTEVVIEAFNKWGVDFVNRLNGMFAIAIYDTVEGHLFLYRDRIGIKPLYYYWDGENFFFASEIKALTKVEMIRNKLTINQTAVNHFLNLGYIPSPISIYNEIHKFPAGHRLHINKDIFTLEPYWKVEDKVEFDEFRNYPEAKKKLKYLIESSVQYRMISDVPFGTFLSGGIDSSLVTAIAQNQSDTAINTFSIGFKESKFNESVHAQTIANHLHTNHHEFVVTTKEAQEMVNDMIVSYDEPYADSSAIPSMLLSKMARKHVTMTLSGDGGDELFLGYGSYKWAKKLDAGFYKQNRKLLAYFLSKMKDRHIRVSKLLDFQTGDDLKRHIFSQEQYLFSQQEIGQILKNKDFDNSIIKDDFSDLDRQLSASEAQAMFDLKYYLPDDLLVKVDRATMKYSLETRVPLLDYRIIEFALNLPEKFKQKGDISKFILKETLYDYLPKSYFERPKAGFSIPMNDWLRTDLKYLIDDFLNEPLIMEAGFVNYDVVKDLIQRWTLKEPHLYNRIWTLIVLHKWYVDIYKNL
jgi:asparagine synthase (glutamine-hydrolysing)